MTIDRWNRCFWYYGRK